MNFFIFARKKLINIPRIFALISLISVQSCGSLITDPSTFPVSTERMPSSSTTTQPYVEINYIGRVVDIVTQEPLQGAKVILEFTKESLEMLTDGEGIFHFTLMANSDDDEAEISVELPGYQKYTRYVDLLDNSINIEDIRLEQIESNSLMPTINLLSPDSNVMTFSRLNKFIISDISDSNEHIMALVGQSVICPRISPGGDRLAFSSNFEGPYNIYIYSADYSLSNITRSKNGWMKTCPSWSPDETRLLYSLQYSDMTTDIVMIDVDGKNEINLTNVLNSKSNNIRDFSNMFSHSPWAPEGNKVVYSSVQGDNQFANLFVLDIEDIVVDQLTFQVTGNNRDAVWSPVGSKIAYVANGTDDETDIWVIDLDEAKPLVPVNLTKNPAHDTDPSWSPDGSKLLFVSDRGGNKDIYMMNSDGSDVVKVTDTFEDESDPYWLP